MIKYLFNDVNKYSYLFSIILIGLVFIVNETFFHTLKAQNQYPENPPEPEAVWKASQSEFEKHIYQNESGDSLNYRLLKPIRTSALADSALPLVVFLHGAGERGSDNIAQLKWGVWRFAMDKMQQEYPTYVVAPQCPSNNSWAPYMEKDMKPKLYKNPTQPMKLAMNLVKEIINDYNIDQSRIYVTGMSMGGMGTWEMLMRRPEWFAAGVPICGAGDSGKRALKKVSDIPIWIFHGNQDKVVNPEFSRDMYKALSEMGSNPGYTEYPGVNHFSWIPTYRNEQLYKWMFSQRKTTD